MRNKYKKYFENTPLPLISVKNYITNLKKQGEDVERIKTLIVNRFNLNNDEADEHLNKFFYN
jgi:hypothetical protein